MKDICVMTFFSVFSRWRRLTKFKVKICLGITYKRVETYTKWFFVTYEASTQLGELNQILGFHFIVPEFAGATENGSINFWKSEMTGKNVRWLERLRPLERLCVPDTGMEKRCKHRSGYQPSDLKTSVNIAQMHSSFNSKVRWALGSNLYSLWCVRDWIKVKWFCRVFGSKKSCRKEERKKRLGDHDCTSAKVVFHNLMGSNQLRLWIMI